MAKKEKEKDNICTTLFLFYFILFIFFISRLSDTLKETYLHDERIYFSTQATLQKEKEKKKKKKKQKEKKKKT